MQGKQHQAFVSLQQQKILAKVVVKKAADQAAIQSLLTSTSSSPKIPSLSSSLASVTRGSMIGCSHMPGNSLSPTSADCVWTLHNQRRSLSRWHWSSSSPNCQLEHQSGSSATDQDLLTDVFQMSVCMGTARCLPTLPVSKTQPTPGAPSKEAAPACSSPELSCPTSLACLYSNSVGCHGGLEHWNGA